MTTTDLGHISLQHDGPIATLTMTRPHKRNAMSLPMWDQLHEQVSGLQGSDHCRVIVIRGADQYFSAGGDLNEVLIATGSNESATYYCHTVVRALRTVVTSAIPTICAINGVASGGGVEIAIAGDVRVAVDSSTLQLPMSHLGVVPDHITLARLCRAMGQVRTHWMLLHGQPVPATVCRDIGLVEQICTGPEFDRAVRTLADRFAAVAPRAQRTTRALLSTDVPTVEEAAVPMIESFLSGEVAAAAHRFLNSRTKSGE